jgi:hypothetical protein
MIATKEDQKCKRTLPEVQGISLELFDVRKTLETESAVRCHTTESIIHELFRVYDPEFLVADLVVWNLIRILSSVWR